MGVGWVWVVCLWMGWWLAGSFVDDTELNYWRGVNWTAVGAHAAHSCLFGLLSDGEFVF